MADKDQEKAPAAEPAPKKKKLPLFMIVVPVLSAAAGVGVTFMLPKSHAPKPEETTEAVKPPETIYFRIADVKTNLARSGGTHFCGLDLTFVFKTKEADAVKARLGLAPSDAKGNEIPYLGGPVGAAARDRIIMLLASKGIEDLEGRTQKELLKMEIKSELQSVLFPENDGTIEFIHFNDILLQ